MSKLSKIVPVVLSGIAIAGTAATAILAVKDTPKAVKILHNKKLEKGAELNKKEVVKAVWKNYLPAAFAFFGTTVCIIAANVSGKRAIASATAACALVTKSYEQYKNKVVELFGKETHDKIISSIAAEKSNDDVITAGSICKNASLEFGDDGEEVLFYDVFSDRYFRSTISRVLQAEYHLNRNYVLRGYVSINEFYEFLGISTVDGGDDVGWSCCDGEISWVDFDHRKETLDDGLEVHFIEMIFCPYDEYGDEIDSFVSCAS